MAGDKLSTFADKIIRLDAYLPGSAGAFSAVGAINPRQAAILDAKHKVLNLTEELRSKNANRTKLIQLFDQMEGSLEGLRTLGVIDGRRLSELLRELKQLRTTAWRR